MLRLHLCLILASSMALAQEFEVVSIKPNLTGSHSSNTNSDRGHLTATNLSLRLLVQMAYDLSDYQVDAPDWLWNEHFDLAAKFPEDLPKDPQKFRSTRNAMLQKMLAERFHLEVRREHRPVQVYALVVDKKGVRFAEAPAGEPHNSRSNDKHYEGTGVSMQAFAGFLTRRMDLPVIDMTGLNGLYKFALDWTSPVSDGPEGLTLREAVQDQLGLRLENRKAPIEVLVVEHIDKVPTGN